MGDNMDEFAKGNKAFLVNQFRQALENKFCAKILWGNRSIYKKDWMIIKKFLHDYKIKTVLEYGVGLSTELMQLDNINVVSIETWDWWAEICKKAIGNEIIVIKGKEVLPDLNRSFDLAFVDGPKGDRTASILHAKRHSQVIYLHDMPTSRQREVNLLNDWIKIDGYGGHFFKEQ
jgi:hypothetical protein